MDFLPKAAGEEIFVDKDAPNVDMLTTAKEFINNSDLVAVVSVDAKGSHHTVTIPKALGTKLMFEGTFYIAQVCWGPHLKMCLINNESNFLKPKKEKMLGPEEGEMVCPPLQHKTQR